MNETELIDYICASYERGCQANKGFVVPFDIFAPLQRDTDYNKTILSLFCSLIACFLIVFSYSRGNMWLTKLENKALTSEKEKITSIILASFILLFELIYVNGQKFMSIAIPTISIDIWILNNGFVIMTLAYAQAFKEHFKIVSYFPFIMYQTTLVCILLIRMESDNFFNNYDIIMILFFVGYSIFHSYSIPACFVMNKQYIRYISDNASRGNTRTIFSYGGEYESNYETQSDATEMQIVNK